MSRGVRESRSGYIPLCRSFFALLGSASAYIQGRQADQASRISIDVHLDQPRLDLLPDFDNLINEWLAEEKSRCLESLKEFERRRAAPIGSVTLEVKSGDGPTVSEILELEERERAGLDISEVEKTSLEEFRKKIVKVSPSLVAALGMLWDPETRTAEEYEGEVYRYLDMASEAVRERVREEYLKRDGGSLGLSIKNLTDRPFGRVKVELLFPRGVEVYLESLEPGEMAQLPQRPHPYGEPRVKSRSSDWMLHSLLAPLNPGSVVPSVERSEVLSFRGAKKVSFAPMDLRPSEEVELPTVFIINPNRPDRNLEFTWEATAIDANGRIVSSLEVQFEQSDSLEELVLGSLKHFLDDGRSME